VTGKVPAHAKLAYLVVVMAVSQPSWPPLPASNLHKGESYSATSTFCHFVLPHINIQQEAYMINMTNAHQTFHKFETGLKSSFQASKIIPFIVFLVLGYYLPNNMERWEFTRRPHFYNFNCCTIFCAAMHVSKTVIISVFYVIVISLKLGS
jgi:hypothetical protein